MYFLFDFVLGMAIGFRNSNRLITKRSDRLNGYAYQNMLIFDMLLSF